MKSYLLVVERNNNDYVPIDWTLISDIVIKNINSLSSIDEFTKSYTEEQLKNKLIEEGLLDYALISHPLEIIFLDNEKTRKLKQGVCYSEDAEALDTEFIEQTLISNIDNKQMMNWIYTFFKGKEASKKYSQELEELLEVIKELNKLNEESLMLKLDKLNNLPYEELRALGLLIKRRILPTLGSKEENIGLKKEQLWQKKEV